MMLGILEGRLSSQIVNWCLDLFLHEPVVKR